MKHQFEWNDLYYFAAFAQMRSLSAVARQFGVTHATVSRHVNRLEENLSIELFDKSPEGYVLTEAGENVFRKVSQMSELADQIPDAIDPNDGLSGTIKITSVPSVIDNWLTQRLPDFGRKYPGVDYQVISDPRNLSLARGESHIAVRLAMPVRGELITRKLTDVSYGLYGTPALIAQLEAGEDVPLIGHMPGSQNIPEAVWIEALADKYRIILRSNSVMTQASTACMGLGLAVLPTYIAEKLPELKSSTFLGTPPSRELWVLVRPDMLSAPRIRAFVDYIVECARAESTGL